MASSSLANWTATRDPPSERDKTPSAVTRSWFEALPAQLRPQRLCLLYPRVANRLALCWPDWALSERLFDDLLTDKRGGRRGFPPEVAVELMCLRQFAAERAPPRELDLLRSAGSQDDKWAQHLQSPSDR